MEHNIEENYREKIYKDYISTSTPPGIKGSEITKYHLEKAGIVLTAHLKKHLPKHKEAKILDLGCGPGHVIYWAKKQGYHNIWGIDISQEQINTAKKLGLENVELADILDYLPNHKNEFDLITMLDVFEHFKKNEIMNVLNGIYCSLHKGGKVIIRTINGESPFHGKFRYGDLTHEIAFTCEGMEQILKASGFSAMSFYPVEPVAHGIKSFIRLVLWRMIRLILRFYLLIETGHPGSGILTQNLIVAAEK